MDHMLLGAALPFVAGALIYFRRGMRAGFAMMLVTPALMIIGAAWAIVPDIPRMLGLMDLYYKMDRDPRCNIFFWHYSIDKVEEPLPVYSLLFVLMIASVFFVAWRELRLTERDAA